MGKKTDHEELYSLKQELWGAQQFLPACKTCGERHPLAMKPIPANPTMCPGCGNPAGEPGEIKYDFNAKTGFDPMMMLGNAMLAVGRLFARLSKGF